MSFFYNPSKAMKEVLHTDKEIIEKLTKELDETKDFYENTLKINALKKCNCSFLNDEEKSYKELYQELLIKFNIMEEKQNKLEKMLDGLGVEEGYDGFLNFVENVYKQNKINNIVDPIDIKKTNDENDNKMDIESITKNIEEKYIEKIHKLEISNKELLKKVDTGIPTPSSSTESKEKVKKEEDNILDLPKNLVEVVYNRNIKNNYSYFKKNLKRYLRCCNTDYKNKEINSTNFITCSKCFRTFNLSEEADENNIYKIFVKILKEHIIKNEEELYKQINCNTIGCNYISKKEIDFCYKCKNMEICIPIITKLPDKDKEGIETVKTFASETHNNMLFYKKVFETAKKEKINVYEMKPLVDFIKNNKLMKEKQPNIIIRKILRSIYILDLYNEDKYIKNQDIIKRIYINLDILAKLDDTQFTSFQNILINMLDKEIDKKGDTKIEDNTLEYSCKNGSCVDNVNIEYTFCDSCKNSLKKCEKCNEEFYTDENNKYCEDCSDSDSDSDSDIDD